MSDKVLKCGDILSRLWKNRNQRHQFRHIVWSFIPFLSANSGRSCHAVELRKPQWRWNTVNLNKAKFLHSSISHTRRLSEIYFYRKSRRKAYRQAVFPGKTSDKKSARSGWLHLCPGRTEEKTSDKNDTVTQNVLSL